MNIVIYARFSSHSQNEQSIEGQLKICYEYARRNNYTVIGEYIDRALTGTTDNRPQFLRMIEDSAKKQFEAVLVYQLDRFSRNRYDSATYKAKLKKNGVRVISARENISDDASGILIEAVLEGMAEYYSAELAQKIRRGMELSAQKCLYVGGSVALGYKVNSDRTMAIDETTAPIVRNIFEMYAAGQTVTQINEYLNAQQVKTIRGGFYNKNSLHCILKNRRYIGFYTYNDTEIPGGVPQIISNDLFYKVQSRMEINKKAPARAKANEEYLLTTKLFCGHCRDMMVGYCGTSKNGKRYYYYICKNNLKKTCVKKLVDKKFIEDAVIAKCREFLQDDKLIEFIAKSVVAAAEKDAEALNLKRLQKLLKENEKAVDNLFKALEAGAVIEQITKRIQEKNLERAELEKQIAKEELKTNILTERKIIFFLKDIRDNCANDLKSRKALITVLVNAIYLYDEPDGTKKITYVINASDKPVEITETLLNNIENHAATCSNIDDCARPFYTKKDSLCGGSFLILRSYRGLGFPPRFGLVLL